MVTGSALDEGMAGFRVRLQCLYIRSAVQQERSMCRNIRTLFNFEPPATEDEIRASALQFVRKLSGFNVPSKANEDAFNDAVEEVTDTARRLLRSLSTSSPPRDREVEAEKARARSRQRFEFGGV